MLGLDIQKDKQAGIRIPDSTPAESHATRMKLGLTQISAQVRAARARGNGKSSILFDICAEMDKFPPPSDEGNSAQA